MVRKIHARFDGETLRPEEPVDLTVNERYLLTIEPSAPASQPADDTPDVLAQLVALATDMGVTDLAERHSEYAHGRKFGDKFPK